MAIPFLTLSGSFMWTNTVFPVSLCLVLMLITNWTKLGISDVVLAALPVDATKVPFFVLGCHFVLWLMLRLVNIMIQGATTRSAMDKPIDNNHPRDMTKDFKGWSRRMQAAHENSGEACVYLIAAIYCADKAALDQVAVAKMLSLFLVARVSFAACYILDLDLFRTFFFGCGFFGCMGLIFGSAFPAVFAYIQ